MDSLKEFDMILGDSGLRQMKAKIDFFAYKFTYSVKHNLQLINYITGDTEGKHEYNKKIDFIMQRNENTSEGLPFTTTIEATIRTSNPDPIWTKQYPYPISDNDFVNKELEKLLNDGIIQRSRSPYNSPIWTVPKKGLDESGKPKRRMVIDFQKLNVQTITDRYPIPDVSMTLQNLGNAKYFSVIDLESGFHQIKIKQSDREKTAFSVNGAKYEFVRMPFGLKNAPAIFQRCVDDILREFIGKFAYVYIDDVLIYSNTPEEHITHISIIADALYNANMKLSSEKSKFFQDSVEYLGHVIKHKRITVDPNKVETIREYPLPTNLKELRSFLGLASYYRKFIENFAHITKPLTIFLRGENGMVKKNQSEKMLIELDEAAINAFNLLKKKLQGEVELFQPDFSKPIELTTDASNFAIGAVLSQNRKPITFISRTLSETEQNYATNEKELLAVIWSLQKLRNYLYGIADLTILTDHQSLIYSISEKNPNSKLKRWKNLIEEYGAKIVYKPGYQNVVADALSRTNLKINMNTQEQSTSDHSMSSSPDDRYSVTTKPLNTYKNQVIIVKQRNSVYHTKIETLFETNSRFTITYGDISTVPQGLKSILNPNQVNAIYCEEIVWHEIIPVINTNFEAYKIIHTQTLLEDIQNKTLQTQIIKDTHSRAHRNARNNILEIQEKYYWPNMNKEVERFCAECLNCNKNKYERKPKEQIIGQTPIPGKAGLSISMDIFYIDNHMYLTSIDRYSKHLNIRNIIDKNNFSKVLEEVITQLYPYIEEVMTDNENIFCMPTSKIIYNRYSIQHKTSPVLHSQSNAQIERVHSTVIELTRLLAEEHKSKASDEIYNAVKQYNSTIHSVTGKRPNELFFERHTHCETKQLLKNNQDKVLKYHNKNRVNKVVEKGDKVFVKTKNRNKNKPVYREVIVEENKENVILTKNNKTYHKDDIRQRIIKNNNVGSNGNIPNKPHTGPSGSKQ